MPLSAAIAGSGAAVASSRNDRARARRVHLLDTARRLFSENGFHRTGIAQISEESGVALGQIYRDFRSKDDIVVAVCEDNLANWIREERFQAAMATADKAAAVAWVEALCIEREPECDRSLMFELLAEVTRNPAIAKLVGDANRLIRSRLEQAMTVLAPEASAAEQLCLAELVLVLCWGLQSEAHCMPEMSDRGRRHELAKIIRRTFEAFAPA